MKSKLKLITILISMIILNGCTQNANTTTSQSNVTTQDIIETSSTTEIVAIGNSTQNIPDITPYVDTLTNDEINNNLSMYLYDIYFYENSCSFIEQNAIQENIEYSQFCIQYINKKYSLDLSTNYPIIDEYYKMLDDEAKQKLNTLSYIDGNATFTYNPNPRHDEIEQQFNDFMEDYYSNVTDEKVQSLGYPFKEITVNNNISSDLVDLEKECVEKYQYHYNGLQCICYENKFNIWGEDVPNSKEYTIPMCFEMLCRMKNFTEQYQNAICESPEDVALINDYIKKYSDAYMYVIQNADSMTDDEVYTYLHDFMFNQEMIDLQTEVYHIDIPNLDEILTITE